MMVRNVSSQFPDTKLEKYSPEQGEVEIYINKEKSYIELENHGAYVTLNPGESLNYKQNWFLIPVPESIKTEAGNQELCDLVRAKLNKMMNEKNAFKPPLLGEVWRGLLNTFNNET